MKNWNESKRKYDTMKRDVSFQNSLAEVVMSSAYFWVCICVYTAVCHLPIIRRFQLWLASPPLFRIE